MKYTAPLESHSVKIREAVLGVGKNAVKIGGEDTLPCHFFEGALPNQPMVALEVLDMQPDNWVRWVADPYRDVLSDPVAWAAKCVSDYGAQTLFLRLQSTDPMGADATAEAAAETARKVLDAVDAPLIVWGTGNEKKDASVLTEVARACSGRNLAIGPVLKGNYEEIGNAAKEHGHAVVAQASMGRQPDQGTQYRSLQVFPPG